MKAKGLLGVLGTVCLATCALGFTACGDSHTHQFTEKKTISKYLAPVEEGETSDLGCVRAKEYYYSCACGAVGTEKFVHHFSYKAEDDKYLKAEGTCESKAQYYYSCDKCDGVDDTNYFEADYDHAYNEKGDCANCDAHVSVGLTYAIDDEGVCKVAGMGTCEDTDVVIPYRHEGKVVEGVVEGAFEGNATITSVEIGEGVTSLGKAAFKDCTALKIVTFAKGNALDAVGDAVFEGCVSLEKIALPDTLKSLSSYMFKDCVRLQDFVVAETVASINMETFKNCDSLTSITIPNGVKSVGVSAFDSCDALTIYSPQLKRQSTWSKQWNPSGCPIVWNSTETEVANDDYVYAVVDGIRYALANGKATIVRQPKTSTIEEIPAKVNYKGTDYTVSGINRIAFSDCDDLTSVTIAEGIQSIGETAFYACDNLTTVAIPTSVTKIGKSAFAACASLQNIQVADSNASYKSVDGDLYTKDGKTLMAYAIGKTATQFTLPASVEKVEDYAFYACKSLTTIVLPDSVQYVGAYAFLGCDNLTDIQTIDNWNYVKSADDWSAKKGGSQAKLDAESVKAYVNYYWYR